MLADADLKKSSIANVEIKAPELVRNRILSNNNPAYDVILYVANWPEKRSSHWKSLLQARAIENCCYVVAANQGGVHNGKRETFGHSVVISPWGKVLSCVKTGPGVACAEMDVALLSKQRESMPVAQHQRFFVEDKHAE